MSDRLIELQNEAEILLQDLGNPSISPFLNPQKTCTEEGTWEDIVIFLKAEKDARDNPDQHKPILSFSSSNFPK
jgi:hypothetical protein